MVRNARGFLSLGGDRKQRQEYASALMENFYPFTLAQVRGARLVQVNFDDAQYYFSQLKTELGEDGLPVPSLRSRQSLEYLQSLIIPKKNTCPSSII